LIYLSGECVHYLEYYVTDDLGNRWPAEGWHNETFKVDNTPPVATKQVGEPKYQGDLSTGNYYVTSHTPIWINVTDAGTSPCIVGSVHLYYRIWYQNQWTNYERYVPSGTLSELIYLSGECVHYLEYYVTDDLGNRWPAEGWHNETFKVDNTPPETVKTFIGPTYNHENEPENYWLRDHDTWVVLDSTDLGVSPCIVGVKYIHVELWMASDGYNIDTLLWAKDIYDQSADDYNTAVGVIQYKFQIDQDCLHEIRWYAVDKLGNKEETAPQQVVLFSDDFEKDLSKWVSHRVTRKNNMYSYDGYYAELDSIDNENYAWMTTTFSTIGYQNIVLSYDARTRDAFGSDRLRVKWRDGTSGPWTEVNAIQNNNWLHYTHTLAGAQNKPVIQIAFMMNCDSDYGLVDNVLVTGEAKMYSQQHRVDSTPPEIVKIVGEPSDYWGQDEYGHDIWDVTSDTKINLDQTYDRKEPCAVGLESIWYKIWYLGGWTDWMLYTGDISFSEHCTHYLEVKAIDYLGNTAYDNETFIVHAQVSEHPTLAQPADGSYLSYKPILVWNPAGEHTNYYLELDDNIDFSSPLISQPVTGTTFDTISVGLADNVPYYWHVAVVYTGGTIGQWSDTWWFTIDRTAPVIDSVTADNNPVVAGSGVLITVYEYFGETGLNGWIVIDGTYYGLIDNSDGTYSYVWNVPASQTPDDYTVTAILEDELGHSDTDNSLVITVISPAGPTTSGTDVEPDSAIVGTTLTVTATVHSTISTITGAEYFIGTKGTPGTGTPLAPVDGVWDETTEEVTATIDTTGWGAGEYTIWVHGEDADNRWGAYDNGEFSLVLESQYRPIFINILQPDDDDGYDTFNVLTDGKYVDVIVDAHYVDDPYYTDVGALTVKIWLDDPYGAPDQFYPVTYNSITKKFEAEIPIYWYSSGSSLNVWAKAQDSYPNRADDYSNFDVTTTVVYDQWMQKEWNSLTLPYGAISCDNSVESVLASINNGNVDLVFYYDEVTDSWSSWKYERPHNTLEYMETGKEYWINITKEAARYFPDTNPPTVEITYPEEGDITNLPGDISGTAYDIETGVKQVHIVIRDITDEINGYWNGETWGSYYELLCTGTESWYYADTSSIDWTGRSGHTIEVTAIATDMAGCSGYDVVSFIIDVIYDLSGTIYYTGEVTEGVLMVVLFDEEPVDPDITPIEVTDIYPPFEFPRDYTFFDLAPGTYYVAAQVDLDDSGGPPSVGELDGYAINKTSSIDIDAINIVDSDVYDVDVTLFVVEGNNPPYTPSNPEPPNGYTGNSNDYNLYWSGGDPDSEDVVSYHVYFGTINPPPYVTSVSTSPYDPGTLTYNTLYYWKIIATDNHGGTTEGPIWNFTTGFDGISPADFVGYWKFDEGTGTTTADASGHGRPGTLYGSPNWDTGKVGHALEFAVPGSFVKLLYSDGVAVSDDWTVMAWVKAAPSATNGQIITRTSDSNWDYGGLQLFTKNDNKAWLDMHSGSSDGISNVIRDNTWHHLVGIRDLGGNLKIYVDGVESATMGYSDVTDMTTFNWFIGSLYNGAYPFGGIIDEVAILDHVLTPTEIALCYNNGLAGHGYMP
jgi:hypothetical protein